MGREFDFSQSDISYFRRKIAQDLLSGFLAIILSLIYFLSEAVQEAEDTFGLCRLGTFNYFFLSRWYDCI